MNDRFLELTQLGKTFPTENGTAVIVRDVNLKVREGEFICLIGHSGCGKSTVLSMVMGLAEPSEGGIVLAGREVDGPGLDRGVVFQTPALLPWLNARDNILLAVDQAMRGAPAAQRLARAEECLGLVGLADAGERMPGELSAGMRQRLGIARAFALEPKLLLLDEPFSLLDAITRMELQDVLMRLWEEKRTTVLMVTHDVDEALLLADRVVMMTSGPAATIGGQMRVPLERPRQRAAALDDPLYFRARDELLEFLENAHRAPAEQQADPAALPRGVDAGHPDDLVRVADEADADEREPAPPRRWLAALGLGLLFALLAPFLAHGEATPPSLFSIPPLAVDGPAGSKVRLEVYERARGEFVDWFATPPNSPTQDYRYDFFGNKFQLGVRLTKDPYEVFVQYQNSLVANLPTQGVGVGSTYYANTHKRTQDGNILRQAWAGTKRLFGVEGFGVKAGRQLYLDSMQAPVTNPSLKWIQQNRLAQRLIGPFDYTHVGRSFDGGQLSFDKGPLNVTGFGFVPTWGGFEIDGNKELDIRLGGLSLNLREPEILGATYGRFFWTYYGDSRDIVFLDNRPLPERQADVGMPAKISTIGAEVAHVAELGPGLADAMAYGFGQFGKWQSERQKAWAYGVELGYRLTDVFAKPWTRIGINSGSGDTNPNDNVHGTFFQLLPTAWLYANFPFYNMMNNQDVFVEWILDPHPLVSARVDLHWLRLNSGRDFDYFGGGATSDTFFGYGANVGKGALELAYVTQMLLAFRATDFLTVNALYAHAFGQGVIDQAFVGNSGNYGYLEGVVAF